jgi:HEAT repeat protein
MIMTTRQNVLTAAVVALVVLAAASARGNGDPAALRAAALDTIANIVLIESDVDEAVRDDAVLLLGTYGGVEHTAVLLQRLESAPSNEAKVIVVRALGALGDATALSTLRDLFLAPESHRTGDDLRWPVSAAAGDALLAMGENGHSVVVEASRSSDAELRRRAIEALARVHDAACAAVAIRCTEDPDRWVRLEAAVALGTLGDAEAVPALTNLLDDTDADVRLEAAKSLARLGDSSGIAHIEKLATLPATRSLALRLLARLDPAANMPALLDDLKRPADDEELDDGAALLAACDPELVVPKLIEACSSDDEALRANAAALLGRLKARDGVDALIACLKDTSWHVRTCATESLGRIGRKSALPPLHAFAEQLARRRADRLTQAPREACALALVQLDDHDAAMPLCLLEVGEHKRVNVPPELAALVDGAVIERVLIASVQQPDPGRPVDDLLDDLKALELTRSRAAGLVIEKLLREQPYAQMHAIDLPEVWAALLDALGGCGGPATAKTAATYATNETPLVRLAACRAILRLTAEETQGD